VLLNMASYLDSVPFSGIIRIRDLMYSVRDPFRLDQGDVSFDAPETVKSAMARAIAENRTHYVQTTGLPRLRELIAAKLRRDNGIPVVGDEEVLVTAGGIHGLYVAFHALLEPGDEVIVPDPTWPPATSLILAARGVPVPCPLHETLGWRFDLDELAARVTARTRAIYLNSPHNPTGGVLTRADLEAIAALAARHGLWVVSDEAYEDVIFEGPAHASIAALPEMYARTIPVYTFSKSYAMTGLRLGYVAVADAALRARMTKVLFLTSSNVSSVVQYGGIGALEGPQDCVRAFAAELRARRDLFYAGVGDASGGRLRGEPPGGPSMPSCGSRATGPTRRREAPRRRSRGGPWRRSSPGPGSDACRAPTLAPMARATSASASHATAGRSRARSSRCARCSVRAEAPGFDRSTSAQPWQAAAGGAPASRA
jgi:aspartate aminotransferase